MTRLIELWPDGRALQEVMKTDAESAGEAVMLAVHQPMRFRKRRVGHTSDEGEWVDETELLEYFLADSPDGRVIVPIVGAPGSGKSHVVRWLNVQLRHRHDATKRRIIRIPKGRSLKGVLEDLLGEVEGPEYENFRQELKQAQDRIDPERAAHGLCEMLAQEVEVLARRAAQLEREGKGTEATKSERAFGERQRLPTLLRDQRLRDQHFVDRIDGQPGVIRRLVAQLYEERVSAPVDDRAHVFLPEDLVFSDDIKRDELGHDVVRAMEQVERDAYRGRCADVLNAALDVSKQQLLGLSPTVTDLFLKIREQLFRDGTELILLVEDFVVLSGLQGQLLQVMIQEAWRDGRQVRCTMRAAIAYTPGYLQTDTVLTRAGYEYRIPDEDESETITNRRIRKLVAAYLNAARVGQAVLTKALEAASDGVSNQEWIPRAPEPEDDNVRHTMEAFGREDSVPLHPFTSEAIAALAEEACRKDHRLLYNPRLVINHILLRVLGHRAEFSQGLFPDARFRSESSPVHLESAIHEWVQRQIPRVEQARYITFLSYWAFGKHSAMELGSVLLEIGPAFSLPAPSVIPAAGDAGPSPPAQVRPEGNVGAPPPTRRVVPTISRWSTLLDAWRKGQDLSESDSRTLRSEILAPRLLEAIDWDWLACRRRDIGRWWPQIWIDGTASNPVSEAAAATVVASADDRRDPIRGARIAAELAALANTHDRGGGWDIDGCEGDLALYCAFVERHASHITGYLFERPFGPIAKWSPLPRTVQGLAIGARVLQGRGGRARSRLELVGALFAETPDPTGASNDETDTWQSARQALARIRHTADGRPSWIEILLDQAAARQGGSALVHAVDVARLRPLLDDVLSRWQLDLQDPPLSPSQRKNASGQALTDAATIESLRRLDAALAQEAARVREWLALMQQHFPADFDPSDFAKRFATSLEALLKSSAGLSHPEARKLRSLLDALLQAPLRAALTDAAQVSTDAPRTDLLWRLGRVSWEVRSISERFIEYADSILAPLELQLSEKASATGDPQALAVAALEVELKQLAAALEEAKS